MPNDQKSLDDQKRQLGVRTTIFKKKYPIQFYNKVNFKV